jgi:hypothetical protein
MLRFCAFSAELPGQGQYKWCLQRYVATGDVTVLDEEAVC